MSNQLFIIIATSLELELAAPGKSSKAR